MILRNLKRFNPIFLFLLCTVCANLALAGDDWREVSAADKALKSSKVEPNADAEVLFWEVRVDDSSEDLVMRHYIRVKIFTEAGREKYSKVDIPFVKGIKIKDIDARVIKADGSISELTKNDVFEREIVKADKIKVKAKSFAIPNIEPGVIVEYRYREVYSHGIAEDMRMYFQHDVPIQNITYYFKPASGAKVLSFNTGGNQFEKDKNGFYRATMENVPAIAEEPYMPPEDEIRAWMIVYYEKNRKSTATDFWSRAGGYVAYKYDIKNSLKPDKEIKIAAPQIAAGANTPEEKVAKLYEFCKTQIKNITYDPTITDEQRDAIKPNKSPKDTLKNLQGTDDEINQLFASLVDAIDLETRFAFGGDRSEKFFDISQAHESFIHFSGVAVQLDGKWRYFDPGSFFTPYGMMEWFEEDTDVLLLNYKNFTTTTVPYSGPEKSVAKRNARLKLSEDGTLEGDVRIEYSGHLSYDFKIDNYDDSPNKREETLKENVKQTMSAAELSGINIENVMDPEKPVIISYKVRVPNYGQKTGKRLFLQPGFFTSGKNALFSASTRKYPVFFHFPWTEEDNVEIQLPEGFSLDNADSPGTIADAQKISSLKIVIKIDKADNKLIYDRKFFFGGNGFTLFSAASYQPVKSLFDQIHEADSHTITLKQD